MRQTPSLIALLTLSATLGIASQARGETIPTLREEGYELSGGNTEVIEASQAQGLPATKEPTISSAPTVLDYFEPAAPAPTFAPGQREGEPLRSPEAEAEMLRVRTPDAETTFVGVDQLSQQPESKREIRQGSQVSEVLVHPEVAQVEENLPEQDAEENGVPTLPPEREVVPLPDQEVDESVDESLPENEMETLPEAQEDAEDELEEEVEEATEDEQADEETQETQVLVAEVAVASAEGDRIPEDLEDIVYEAIDTRPGARTTRSQIQQDINNVFATGFFANVRAEPEDTPLGVRVTFIVDPNPVLTDVVVQGSQVLPEEQVDEIFAPQYGEIINLLEFQDGILALNNWYQENGYVLAQVIAAPAVSEDGVVTLQVAEGVIEDINVQFVTQEGLTETEEGEPIKGKTREFIILREFETEPGDVFQQSQIQSDLQSVFGLGIFEDVTLTLNPGQDPQKVDVTVNVVEGNTGSVAAGVGFNFTGDLFGTLSYRQDNFGGNNQKFQAEAQLSFRDILFDVSFTDPWIGGDPYMTSYTLNGFGRRSISLVFDGGPNEINLDNGDRVRINRFGAGVTFRRPLGNNWDASLGTLYQRVRTTDADGNTFTEDAAGNPLTASGDGADDLWTFQFGVVQDLRNNSFAPTSGSVLRLGTEQSIPLGSGSIFFNRLRASYSYYIPVSFLNFSEGPQAIAINVQGGSIIGDFPPYEAFAIGGTNSVRGYDEGELGTGQSYLQASVEYRFPLFSFLGGAVFLDAGTDLGTGDSVPGSPGPDRGKPGSGFGYGLGVRVDTPLGPIRVDYGISDQGDGRIHFGIGERF